MNNGSDCKRLQHRLPNFAAGNHDEEVEHHLKDCPNCNKVVAQLAELLSTLAVPRFEPPQAVVRRASELFRPVRKSAKVVRTSLAGAGARRSQADRFQCLFAAGRDKVRVAYARQATTWVVQGEAPKRFTHLLRGKRKSRIEDGKFRFECKSLPACGFILVGEREELEVPPPEVGS